jgi:arabinoxylan arabinofuranohydrolase
MYFGGGVPEGRSADPGSGRVVQLGDDMISIVGEPQEIYIPYLFEALDMVKHNGRYYLSYCSNWQGPGGANAPGAAQIAYMVGDHPMGPFEYQGVILRNPGQMFGLLHNNNHHSKINFKGEWYLLYHATLVADAKGIRSGSGGQLNYRSTHLNKLTFLPDGTIEEVMGDRKGVPQLMPFNPYVNVEAETIAWSSSISTLMFDPTQRTDLNLYVSDLHNGDWIAVAQADFEEGAASFGARIRGNAGGAIELRLDALDGELIGTLEVPANTDWIELEAAVSGAAGVRDLFMVFTGDDGAALFDFDRWNFSKDGINLQEETDTAPAQTETPASGEAGGSGISLSSLMIIGGIAIAVIGSAVLIILKRRK